MDDDDDDDDDDDEEPVDDDEDGGRCFTTCRRSSRAICGGILPAIAMIGRQICYVETAPLTTGGCGDGRLKRFISRFLPLPIPT